ncbi:MAG: metallophosphoesterase [Flavobacteriales bacterium]|nr:metallophosphoesterase [Flavobacteriales bacterium]
MRLLVLSDLHACAVADYALKDSSHYSPHNTAISDLECPIRSLLGFIDARSKKDAMVADYVICPGDIIHQAQPEGLSKAWEDIHTIARKVNAKTVIATAGNHDVDSRHKHSDFDPKGELQTISPFFPLADETFSNEFWSRNLTIIQESEANIVVLNTCAYHGSSDVPDEQKHGRISRHTLNYLDKRLSEMVNDLNNRVNILLCHHHPQPVATPNANDFQDIKGGADLLAILNKPDYGSWLMIHGHIHYPYVEYARGTTTSPIIFSAGSVAAKLYWDLGTTTRNQFYILDISRHPSGAVVGQGQAYIWGPGHGWKEADAQYGIPPVFGFGIRNPPASWIPQISSAVSSFLSWDELVTAIPDLKYVSYGDIAALAHHLRRNGSPRFQVSEVNGSITEIVKLVT